MNFAERNFRCVDRIYVVPLESERVLLNEAAISYNVLGYLAKVLKAFHVLTVSVQHSEQQLDLL